jgi:glycosyltransferase involved in cell wall biosynthesis
MSGTHHDVKDPSLFVDLARRVLHETPQAHFLWVGGTDNAYSVFVKEKAKRLGLTANVTWVPPQTEDYYNYLDAADGFVLTSKRESLGLVLLEAAALAKPIVAFESAGPREILRPGMGTLIEGRDVSSLVATMLKVMGGDVDVDPRVSRRRAAEFDISIQGRRWQRIIDTYLATMGAPL